MALILTAGLPNVGLCMNMTQNLVYGPSKYQGIGVNNLYKNQRIVQLKALLDHVLK